MSDFISDEQMSALQQSGQAQDFISDDEMARVAPPSAPRGRQVYTGPIGPNPEMSVKGVKKQWGQILGGVPAEQRHYMPGNSYHEDNKPVAGTPPLAMPLGPAMVAGIAGRASGFQAPALANKFGKLMQTSKLARLGGSAAEGAAHDSENRLRGAGTGLLWGAGGELLASTLGALTRTGRVAKYTADPVAAQDAAIDTIEGADDALRTSRKAEAAAALEGKTYKIDPRAYQGSVSQADDAIREGMVNKPYPDLPAEMEIPAMRGEEIRSALDSPIKYPKGTMVSATPEIADKFAKNKALADNLRAQRAQHGGDEASQLYDAWSESLHEADSLGRMAKRTPVSALTREGTDAAALRGRIDSRVGSKLNDVGSQLQVAERLRNPQGIEGFLKGIGGVVREGVKGTWKEPIANSATQLDPLAIYLSSKWPGKNKSEK